LLAKTYFAGNRSAALISARETSVCEEAFFVFCGNWFVVLSRFVGLNLFLWLRLYRAGLFCHYKDMGAYQNGTGKTSWHAGASRLARVSGGAWVARVRVGGGVARRQRAGRLLYAGIGGLVWPVFER
jgi:hypothetical protein